MTPEPATLFINGMMRKPVKSKLHNHLLSLVDGVDNPCSGVCVVDGGCLIHQTSWLLSSTYDQIASNYVKFINLAYPCVVFDGYTDPNSTRSEEHRRRNAGKKSSPNIVIKSSMKLACNKQEFLSNSHNKMQLIEMLKKVLDENGIEADGIVIQG